MRPVVVGDNAPPPLASALAQVAQAPYARPVGSAAVVAYALRLGDDALIAAQRLVEWAARSPQLEEDVALANVALDLLGQARLLLAYAGQVEGAGRDEDDLAFLRDEPEFVNCQLVELDGGDFARTMARLLLFSLWQRELYGALAGSTDEVLAGVAAKAVKEVAYHVDHARTWVLRLGDGTAESACRMQAGLDEVWPHAFELFEDDDLTRELAAAGVGVLPSALRAGWEHAVTAVVTEATLVLPSTTWRPTGGRRGLHTEAFGYLLAELQHLHRSHPGASW